MDPDRIESDLDAEHRPANVRRAVRAGTVIWAIVGFITLGLIAAIVYAIVS